MINHSNLNDTMPMDTLYTSHQQYNDDSGSVNSRSISGSKRNAEEFACDDDENPSNNAPRVSIDNNVEVEDKIIAENLQQVTQERQMIYKENTTRLQSILENIKNSTKTMLEEMNIYLQEMEDVEKMYIKCRAKTQKEGRRLEQVAPDVGAATQNFLNQASSAPGLFGSGRNGEFLMSKGVDEMS